MSASRWLVVGAVSLAAGFTTGDAHAFYNEQGYINGMLVRVVKVNRFSKGGDQDWQVKIRPAGCTGTKFGRDCAQSRTHFVNTFWNAGVPSWSTKKWREGARDLLDQNSAACGGFKGTTSVDKWADMMSDPQKWKCFPDGEYQISGEISVSDDDDDSGVPLAGLDLTYCAEAEDAKPRGLCGQDVLIYGMLTVDMAHPQLGIIGKPEVHPIHAIVRELEPGAPDCPANASCASVVAFADYGKASKRGTWLVNEPQSGYSDSAQGYVQEGWSSGTSYVNVDLGWFKAPPKPDTVAIPGTAFDWEQRFYHTTPISQGALAGPYFDGASMDSKSVPKALRVNASFWSDTFDDSYVHSGFKRTYLMNYWVPKKSFFKVDVVKNVDNVGFKPVAQKQLSGAFEFQTHGRFYQATVQLHSGDQSGSSFKFQKWALPPGAEIVSQSECKKEDKICFPPSLTFQVPVGDSADIRKNYQFAITATGKVGSEAAATLPVWFSVPTPTVNWKATAHRYDVVKKFDEGVGGGASAGPCAKGWQLSLTYAPEITATQSGLEGSQYRYLWQRGSKILQESTGATSTMKFNLAASDPALSEEASSADEISVTAGDVHAWGQVKSVETVKKLVVPTSPPEPVVGGTATNSAASPTLLSADRPKLAKECTSGYKIKTFATATVKPTMTIDVATSPYRSASGALLPAIACPSFSDWKVESRLDEPGAEWTPVPKKAGSGLGYTINASGNLVVSSDGKRRLFVATFRGTDGYGRKARGSVEFANWEAVGSGGTVGYLKSIGACVAKEKKEAFAAAPTVKELAAPFLLPFKLPTGTLKGLPWLKTNQAKSTKPMPSMLRMLEDIDAAQQPNGQ